MKKKTIYRISTVFLSALVLSANIVCYAAVDPGFANGETATIGTGPGMHPWPSLGEGFGGSATGEIYNTNITLDRTADHLAQMYGGSKTGAVNGGTNLMYNGNSNFDFKTATSGYGMYHLYGGNQTGIVGGGTHLTMNSGWVRGWIIGGGAGTVNGDSIVDISGGLVGACIDNYSDGQGEVYGGPMGIGSVLYGNTHVNISGSKYNPETYTPGDNPTVIRQHVLGGGNTGGLVVGSTFVNISGGTILGHVAGAGGGGGIANIVTGDTHVTVAGGEIGEMIPDLNGGSVFGGGYANGNNVEGNTFVTVSNDAYILGDVYGGGKSKEGQSNTVNGNSTVDILGGLINGNIYGGGQAGAIVKGYSNINLKHIIADNPFIEHFTGAILAGNAEQDVNVNFMNYHGLFHGSIGNSASARAETAKRLGEVKIFDYSKVIFAGGKTYDAKLWKIEGNASAAFFADATITADNFIQIGNIELNNYNRPNYVTLTIDGNYVSAGGTINMSAKSNTAKDFLIITGNADLTSGRTTIFLTLDEGWEGDRIDLVDIQGIGAVESFDINVKDFEGGEVVLKKEELPDGVVEWYIVYQETPDPQGTTQAIISLAFLSVLTGIATFGMLAFFLCRFPCLIWRKPCCCHCRSRERKCAPSLRMPFH